MEAENWMPMESNPEVMNGYAEKLGFNTEEYSIQDVVSTEDWAQDMVPRPVLGVILLFQDTEKQQTFSKAQKETLKEENNSKKLFYMKQYAHNACGTIAIFHVILNSMDDYPDLVKPNTFFTTFKAKQSQSPEQIGEQFKKSKEVKEVHKESAQEGQSEVKCQVDSHFIAFTEKDGHLYELDGCKKMPVNHGPCEKDQVLERSCEEIKKFMVRDPDNINFSILVVAKKGEL